MTRKAVGSNAIYRKNLEATRPFPDSWINGTPTVKIWY